MGVYGGLSSMWPIKRKPSAATGALPVGGEVVAFPDTDLIRLERFARDIRARLERGNMDRDAFALRVIPGTNPRLWIDDEAFVEFDAAQRCHRMVVQASGATRVIFETSDFERIDRFVRHYILDQVTDAGARALLP